MVTVELEILETLRLAQWDPGSPARPGAAVHGGRLRVQVRPPTVTRRVHGREAANRRPGRPRGPGAASPLSETAGPGHRDRAAPGRGRGPGGGGHHDYPPARRECIFCILIFEFAYFAY